MKILEWIATNPSTVEVEVEEVYDQGNQIGLKFVRTTPFTSTPNPMTATPAPSGMIEQQPIPQGMPSDYFAPCDSVKCENGKYKLQNGNYNNCFRCNGRGYLTRAKAASNANWDQNHK